MYRARWTTIMSRCITLVYIGMFFNRHKKMIAQFALLCQQSPLHWGFRNKALPIKNRFYQNVNDKLKFMLDKRCDMWYNMRRSLRRSELGTNRTDWTIRQPTMRSADEVRGFLFHLTTWLDCWNDREVALIWAWLFVALTFWKGDTTGSSIKAISRYGDGINIIIRCQSFNSCKNVLSFALVTMKGGVFILLRIYNQRLAGYLMYQGIKLSGIEPNKEIEGFNVFLFEDSPRFVRVLEQYQTIKKH